VTMRTSRAQGEMRHAERDGYRVVRKSGRYGVFPAAAFESLARVQHRYDAVFEAWNGIPFLTPLWFRGPRLAIVHHVHKSMWPEVFHPALAHLGWFIEGNVAPRHYQSTPLLTPSASSRRDLVDLLGLPLAHIDIAAPGIDHRFRPAPVKSARPLVLTVGRLTPTKNVGEMIHTMVAVRERQPDVEFLIVGDGYERANLQQIVDDLDVRSWIRFTGKIPFRELVSLYQEAWAVVSASTAEGWGMALTEAAACGTPAVVSDISGHRDSVVDGVTGFLASDPADHADKLVAVLGDAELRDRLAAAAQQRAAQFTWENTALTAFRALARQLRY
jgi:glycosyltransferase involved in cell wall biosynthesis